MLGSALGRVLYTAARTRRRIATRNIQLCMPQLSAQERRNLLRYKFGTSLSNLEIGEIMNKSESAIKSLYFRTLAALRQDLDLGRAAEVRRAHADADVVLPEGREGEALGD